MERRKFLSTVAVGVALAGCGSDDTETVDDQSGNSLDGGTQTDAPDPTETAAGEATDAATESPTPTDAETPTQSPTETPTETRTPTGTPTPAGEPEVVIQESELVVDDSGFSTETHVAATVTNEGDSPSGQVVLTARWYDENGDLLDDSSARLPTLDAGETWAARVEALSDDERIDDFELEGEFEREPPQPPADVELVESELQTGEEDVTVTGRVTNNTGDELGYVEAIAKLYDDQGRVLSGNYTNETDIPADETWRFEISWVLFARADAVADHEALLSGTAL